MVTIERRSDVELQRYNVANVHAGADTINTDQVLDNGGRFASGSVSISTITAGVLTDYGIAMLKTDATALAYGDIVTSIRIQSRKTAVGAGTITILVEVLLKRGI